jgi:hypothetical protein
MNLHVFATVDQREQMLRQKARTQWVAHAKDHVLLSHFLEQCIPFEEKRLCSPPEQVLVAWEVIRRHPRENRGNESDFRVAQLFVEQLKSIRLQGCSLEDWKQVSLKLKEHAQLLWFADVWEEYTSRLSALSLMDEVDVLHAAIGELGKKNIPKQLHCVSRVFVHGLVQTTPLEQRFFFALEKALSSVGSELFLETCGVDNPELDGLVDELHGEFECAEESSTSNLNLLRNVLSPSSPAFELCKHLFRETCSEVEKLPLDFFVASNFCREVRETAKRIAHLLKLGVAPESIAVVLCGDANGAHAVWHELSSCSIPAHVQEVLPLSSCALGNAALGWLQWTEDGFPVERAHVFFSNPLFEKTFVHHDDFGIWLQRAGIGYHSKQESLEGYVARLSLLQESGQLDDVQRSFLETLKERIGVAKNASEKILKEGNFEEMLESWYSSLQELGFNLSALTHRQLQDKANMLSCHPQDASFNALQKQIHRKTLARENAAGTFFRQAFLDWKLKLQKTETKFQKLTRKEFSEWVWTCLGNEPVRIREPKTASVTISHFKAMRNQEYKHIFFLGMKEGAFSQRKKNALLSEALQSLVNANSTPLFFRIQRGESLHRLPEDIALERQNFIEAVTCATEKLWFSYSLAEHGGRDVVPSSFWQEALRISKKTMPASVQVSRFSQQPNECMTEFDFRGHVAQKIRQHFYGRKQKAPLAPTSLRQESWFLSLLEKSEAEHERFCFRCDRTRKAGAYTGNVLSPRTEKHLREFTKLPWSAHAFGRLGGCAFWFFMSHVLRGEVFESFRMDVGAKTKGVLLHRALALLGGDVVSLSKTSEKLREAQQRERIAEVVKTAQETLEGLVHPELWALCCEQVQEELFALLNSKSLFPFGVPQKTATEWRFEEEVHFEGDRALGFEAKPEVAGSDEGAFEKQVLKLTGRLDRLDVLDDDSVGVVDYKLSKQGSKNKYRESLLVDEFQLLLYLFILRKKGLQAKHASWVFIREKANFLLEEWMTEEELNEILEEDTEARISLKKRGRLNLLNRMEALVSQVAEGNFAPLPVDCRYCPFKRACRISESMTTLAETP